MSRSIARGLAPTIRWLLLSAATAAGACGAKVDVSPAAGDARPACGCCGKPFAVRSRDFATNVIATSTGEVLVGGTVIPGPGSVGPVWLARVGDGGATIWRREYEGEVGLLAALVETGTGGFVLLRSEGSRVGGGTQLMAVSADGTLRWTKKLTAGSEAGGKDFAALGIAATLTGLVIVGRYTQPGAYPDVTWVGRFDLDGNLLAETSDSAPTATSMWYAVSSSRRGAVAMCGLTPDGASTVCAVESADGTPVWRRTLSLDWRPAHIALAEDGALYLAGARQTFEPAPPETAPSHVMVARFDGAGELVWQKERGWSKPAQMSAQALAATPDGGFALHGYLSDVTLRPGPPPPGTIAWYWYAVRGDASGAISWAKGYAPAGPPGGQGRAIAACKDGVVLVGTTHGMLAESWWVRTSATGEAPFLPPGSTIDL